MPARLGLYTALALACGVSPTLAATPTITIASPYVRLTPNQPWLFTATLSGGATGAVIWQVNNVIGGTAATGTISAAGIYTGLTTLPPLGAVTVTAALAGNPMVTATATITIAATAPTGKTYYVATTGNDTAAGTEAAPFRTIKHAVGLIAPGDTVYVRQGVYNERLVSLKSGNAAAGYITFSAYPGETVTLDGTGLPIPGGQAGLVDLANASYVVVQGFGLRNYRTGSTNDVPIGIYVHGLGTNVQLINNHVYDIITTAPTTPTQCQSNALGVAVYGTGASVPIGNLVISGNELDDLKTGCSESMSIDGNVDGFVVASNYVHNNNNIGIDAIGFEPVSSNPAVNFARNGEIRGNVVANITSYGNPDYGKQYASDGIYVDGGANITIEQNLIHNVDYGIELASEHEGHVTSEVIARNNVIYASNASGVTIGGYAANKGGTDHCEVINNTLFADNTKGQQAGEFQIQYNATNNLFANNIVYAGKAEMLVNGYAKATIAPTAFNNNLYFAVGNPAVASWTIGGKTYTGFATYRAATGLDGASVFANPLFVSLAVPPNLDIGASSPAIGVGVDLGTALGIADFAGQPRVKGSKVDVGAFEE
jgi:parallel beta-helix repeat protein